MKLPDIVNAALQTFGLGSSGLTKYDQNFLQQVMGEKALVGFDSIGRTNPLYQMVGNDATYLSPEQQKLRQRLVGQFGRANSYFATKAASLPLNLWTRGTDGKPKQEPYDAPLLDLLWQPNPMTSYSTFMWQISSFWHGEGTVPIWANRLDSGPNKGRPQELWILPPPCVKPMGGGYMEPVTSYRYTPDPAKPNEYIDLDPSELLFLKNGALPGEARGTSTAQSAYREVTTDKSTSDAQNSLMQHGGPPGIISFPPDKDTAITLSAPTIFDIRNRFDTRYSGPENRGKIPIVTEKVEFVSTGATAVDLAILELRMANFREVCGWFGFSSVLLGDMEASTDNNYQNARKAFYTDALVPYANSNAGELSRWLCPLFGYKPKQAWLEVDTSGIPELQEDKKAETERIMSMYLLPIERRVEMLGETPDPAFKGYLIPAGLQYFKNAQELSESLTDEGQKLLGRYNEYPGVSAE
ncbi:phage portal protein [Hymenobacter mucosus]|uniref:Phage portal protein, HK97 family n=1 Tax=Hymenobacter mucosus TaxID=1411120 RepID=A0A239AAH7_9BACT|nr:phage portal protein [Hymenobacter mucosus]SNR92068.1 phage portal protein, HK97 family [Hymenobacter mucosus]